MGSDLEGFVLAGGRSARFGEDKALARVDRTRLVDVVASALAPVCSRVRIVRRPGQAAVDGHDVLVGDEGADHHPLWGVAVALEAAGTARALTVPCDLVGIRTADLRAFLAGIGDGEGIAWDGTRAQPLLAVLETHRADEVRAAAAGGASVHRFMADRRRIRLPEAALRNLNRRP